MDIKILGTGCPNCQRLEAHVRQAASDLGLTADIGKVTDIAQIMKHGVMRTPGLVVDGQVKVSGRVPTLDEVRRILETAGAPPAGPAPAGAAPTGR
ncbi:MAG: thioredoxin family protein [Bacillota bacterium]